MSDLLTIITPTHNRSHFLRRMLSFFRDARLVHPITIVDSSDPENRSRNLDVISEFQDLRVRYTHYDMLPMKKCCKALEAVQTPFVAFCADDDFQFPKVVDQCIEYLSKHSDYTCVQGRVLHASNHRLRNQSTYKCHFADSFDIDDEDPVKRFVALASNVYSTFYAVHRTSVLSRAFTLADEYTD